MSKWNSRPARRDVTERVGRARDDMRSIEKDAGIADDDLDTVRHTLDSLDLGGTQEGVDAVVQPIEGAKRSTEADFGNHYERLDREQANASEHKSEVQDRHVSVESDQRKISDASQRIRTRDALRDIALAGESAQRELEFLSDTIRTAEANLAESDKIQEDLRARVYGGRAH